MNSVYVGLYKPGLNTKHILSSNQQVTYSSHNKDENYQHGFKQQSLTHLFKVISTFVL